MKKCEMAKSYREIYGNEMPSLKLARIMYEKEPLMFKNVESARYHLRYIEGKGGRSPYKKSPNFKASEWRPLNPYKLPESEEIAYEPFVFKGHKRIGIISDVHLPYHNEPAITAAITYFKAQKIDALLLNGDIMDCHMLSRFQKNPKKRDFKYELDVFKGFINVLETQLSCKIYFKLGNHEIRYEKFLYEKAKELVGVEEFMFENIIKARARGIEIIGDKVYMKLNSLNGIHGHEYIGGISTPVNIARGLYLRGKVSAFQGHNHSTSEHTETDMNGHVTTTWSMGCLCELHPEYMPLNKWNHGCADVDLSENGVDYEFRNKRIYKGKIL